MREHLPTMYESIPAVAELNRVPGFEPFKLLRRVISPENGEERLQLDLRFKKLWFRLAHPKGRIRLNPLRITEQMAIFEAQVYLDRSDGEPVGCFTASCTKEDAPGGQYVQAAQFEAMDEALTDAGFGVQFVDVSMGSGSRYGNMDSMQGGRPAGNAGAVLYDTGALQKPVNGQGSGNAGSAARFSPGEATGRGEAAQKNGSSLQVQATQPVLQDQRETAQTAVQKQGEAVQVPIQKQEKAVSAAVQNQGEIVRAADPETAGRMEAGVQTRASLMAQNGKPAGSGQAIPVKGQDKFTAGSARAFHPVMTHGQATRAAGNPNASGQPMAQGNPILPANAQVIKRRALAGEAADTLPVSQKETDKLPVPPKAGETASVTGKVPSAGRAGTKMHPTQQTKTAQDVQPHDRLPVSAPGPDSLPVQPKTVGPAVTAGILPAAEKDSAAGDTWNSVQGAMALLNGGNNQPSGTGMPVTKDAPVPGEAAAVGQQLPISGSNGAEKALPQYTPDMPVEEILKRMTLEEAGQVVVDMGVSKGQTMAEVAERRPSSLKFYQYGGYKGNNNILRAAAQVMLESLAAQKTG